MKLVLIGVAALASLSACAVVTKHTGLSNEQQVCIATQAAEVIQNDETADLPMLDKIGFVAANCGIDLNALFHDTIQTAILAVDKAE